MNKHCVELYLYYKTVRTVITASTGLIPDLVIIISECIADDLHNKILVDMINSYDPITQITKSGIAWALRCNAQGNIILIINQSHFAYRGGLEPVSTWSRLAKISTEQEWLIKDDIESIRAREDVFIRRCLSGKLSRQILALEYFEWDDAWMIQGRVNSLLLSSMLRITRVLST